MDRSALPVEYDRFVGDHGKVALRLNNIEASPVRFEQAQVRLRACSGLLREQDVAIDDLLDLRELAAEQISEGRIVLDPAWTAAEVCRVELSLSGDTVPPSTGKTSGEDGLPNRPVTAKLSFDLGVPKFVEEGGASDFAGRPLTDP